jgi:hypothetical protein
LTGLPERWRPIPGHRGYEASSESRVRSVARTLRDGRTAGGTVLAQQEDKDGYPVVRLGRKQVRVDVAVILAFQGPAEVRHLDGNRKNNRPGNLAYGSHLENERDKGRERKEGEKEGTESDIGNCSCPLGIAASPVSPVTEPVSLSDAVRLGIVSGNLPGTRKARWSDPAFPDPVGRQGKAYLYDAAHLAEWDSWRRGRSSRAG